MDQYKQLFLASVKCAIQMDASKETLLALLQITWPELTETELTDVDKRKKALERLKDSLEGQDALISSVEAFYNKACEDMNKRKKQRTVSPTAVSHEFPPKFHVKDTWAHLNSRTLKPKEENCEGKHVAALAAAHCINARGAIAHKRKTEIYYEVKDLLEEDETKETTVKSIFDRKGKGTKTLKSIAEIKKELMDNGPVVSTSFVLDEVFAAQKAHKKSFSSEMIGKMHEVLILGWKLTELGEVWVVKPPLGSSGELTVAFGQFGIDRVCVAPTSDFKMETWQEGPYWDIDGFSDSVKQEWNSWKGMRVSRTKTDTDELISLLKCFDGGDVCAAARDKTRFVVRDKNELADSRACTLDYIKWNKLEKEWEIGLDFVD